MHLIINKNYYIALLTRLDSLAHRYNSHGSYTFEYGYTNIVAVYYLLKQCSPFLTDFTEGGVS